MPSVSPEVPLSLEEQERLAYEASFAAEEEVRRLFQEMDAVVKSGEDRIVAERKALELYGDAIDAAMEKSKVALHVWFDASRKYIDSIPE